MEIIEQAEINKQIVLTFLQKVELLTSNERAEILKVIEWINRPIFVTNNIH